MSEKLRGIDGLDCPVRKTTERNNEHTARSVCADSTPTWDICFAHAQTKGGGEDGRRQNYHAALACAPTRPPNVAPRRVLPRPPGSQYPIVALKPNGASVAPGICYGFGS